MPGIKVDKGTVPLPRFPGEKLTQGLDGLAERLAEYRKLGARFAKWRAVIDVAPGIPTPQAIAANAYALARYAAMCQDQQIVPIVEPEVLMDGDHTIATAATVTDEVLHTVFDALHRQRVVLECMILKPNMVVPGLKCPQQAPPEEVARATLACLRRNVPAAVPGIFFLSGGHERRGGDGQPERDERRRAEAAVGSQLFVWARAAGRGARRVARRSREEGRRAAGVAQACASQRRGARRQVHVGDGNRLSSLSPVSRGDGRRANEHLTCALGRNR